MNDLFLDNVDDSLFQDSYDDYFDQVDILVKKFGEKIPTLFHPIILSKEDLNIFKRQSEKISIILEKVAKSYFYDKRVSDFFYFPSEIDEWVRYQKQYERIVPISRYDAFFENKKISFCEFNTDGSSGFNDMFNLEEAFLSTSFGKKLKRNFKIERFNLPMSVLYTLLECYDDSDIFTKKNPKIAIVDYLEKASMDEFLFFKEFFCKNGYETEICDIRQLEIHRNRLFYKNFEIDIVYRRAVTDDIFLHKKESEIFLKACRDSLSCIIGPLSSHIIHSKILFPLFFTDLLDSYLTIEELKAIRESIPYTNFLVNESKTQIEDIKNNKDNYFIKPHNTYGSNGVICGLNLSSDQWSNMLDSILQKNDRSYLIQKRISVSTQELYINNSREKIVFNIQLDPYVLNGFLKGCFVRVSRNNVTSFQPNILPLFFL